MALYIICFLFLLTSNHRAVSADDLTDVFEFGINKGKVTFETSGKIGNWASDKITVVPISVPECNKITYLKVEVRNSMGPPYVKFDDATSSVIIKYRRLQYSISNYAIIAKTKKINCNEELKDQKKTESEVLSAEDS